jgi:hypothetical protein
MRGIEFVIDEKGEKRAVLIDLRQHRELWEDIYDAYLERQRRHEPRESLEQVKKIIQGAAEQSKRD